MTLVNVEKLISKQFIIKGGIYMGFKTILVLSGIADKEKLNNYAFKPSLVVDSVDQVKFPLAWWKAKR